LPTPSFKTIPEPWLSFLQELDSAVDGEVRLHCKGGFVITMVYGFSRPTADLDVLEIAPKDAARQMLELGMQGHAFHRKYKLYLDQVGVAHVPENYEDRLKKYSLRRLEIFASLLLIRTISHYPSWNGTSSVIETM
jgi:hypothetical protein